MSNQKSIVVVSWDGKSKPLSHILFDTPPQFDFLVVDYSGEDHFNELSKITPAYYVAQKSECKGDLINNVYTYLQENKILEEIKGTEMLKNAYKKLKELSNDNNFIFNGYIEGNKIMSGESNVIVTDGFTGNIALKTAEGTAKFITDNLKSVFLPFKVDFFLFCFQDDFPFC